MSKIVVLFSILLLSIGLNAQNNEPFEKVSKQYSLEFGARRVSTYSNFNNKASNGVTALFDYAWKLSGYNKKKNAYISVPLGFSMFYADKDTIGNEGMKVLNYGWTVRHELRKDKKFTPYIGYGLLLNQLWINKIDGNAMGHQTKFELGGNYNLKGKMKMYAKIEYSMMRFPALNAKKAMKISTSDIVVGVRF